MANSSYGKGMALSITPVDIKGKWGEDARPYGPHGAEEEQERFPLISLVTEEDPKVRKENLEEILKHYDYAGDDLVEMVTTLTFGYNPGTGDYDFTMFNEKMSQLYQEHVNLQAANLEIETNADLASRMNQQIVTFGTWDAAPGAYWKVLDGPTNVSEALDTMWFKFAYGPGKKDRNDAQAASQWVEMMGQAYGLEMKKYAQMYIKHLELKHLGILSDSNLETMKGLHKNKTDLEILYKDLSSTRKKGGKALDALIQTQQANKYNPSGM
jgi:hypothetical protein